MSFMLKPIILYIVAVFLLKITGRRSLAQMTISQTILIISLGAIIVEPFADKDVKKTIIVAAIFTILLILFEVLEYYSKSFEKFVVGKEILIVNDGIINQDNMKKLKFTNYELFSRLRQEGINKIEHIKKATIEPNGELGYELIKEAQPITVGDMQFILNEILSNDNNSLAYINLVQQLKNKEH